MGSLTLITGGARSGKSRFAESLLAGRDDVIYVATAIPFDAEMSERISLHRSRRNSRWETIEAYRGLAAAVGARRAGRGAVLLDCVTVMVSNIMVLDSGVAWEKAASADIARVEGMVMDEIGGFLAASHRFSGEVIIVSNEVGMGIVPEAPLGRHFRDIAGRVNQAIADAAGAVYLMVSGLPLKVK